MEKEFSINRLCDKCYEVMKKDEEVFGFKMIDDLGDMRAFKGHHDCMVELSKIIAESMRKFVEEGK